MEILIPFSIAIFIVIIGISGIIMQIDRENRKF